MSEITNLIFFAQKYAKQTLTPTGVPRFDIIKVMEPTELFPEIYQPMVSLILQGKKRLLIGNQILDYSAGETFISSVELPVSGEIVEASTSAPYLALRLIFDRAAMTHLMHETANTEAVTQTKGYGVSCASEKLINAWSRMLDLIEMPDEIPFMAPMIEREIFFRLLRGPQGKVLSQIFGINPRFTQMKNAIVWIRNNYAMPFRVEEIARYAMMSPSTFNRHFKEITGLSPLQYQKQIRLYEARRMLLSKPGDVAAISFAVGYESLSQFTREYRRMFGLPPARDITNLIKKSSRTPPLV